jgi:hypothetical protein
MALRDCLPFQTDPETVDRASRRERWKRQAWVLGSTIIGFGVVGIGVSNMMRLFPVLVASETAAFATAGVAIILAFALDMVIFQWGIERFDLVFPWQFREAESGDEPEVDDAAD